LENQWKTPTKNDAVFRDQINSACEIARLTASLNRDLFPAGDGQPFSSLRYLSRPRRRFSQELKGRKLSSGPVKI
jgi:hypothetical protein